MWPFSHGNHEPRFDGTPSWKSQIQAHISEGKPDDDVLRQDLANALKYIVPPLASKLRMREGDILNRIIGPEVTDRMDVNGYVVRENGGDRFRVRLNFGLLHFNYKMWKLFVSHFGVGDRNSIKERPHLPNERVTNVAVRLLQAYWDNTIATTATIPISELTESQVRALVGMMQYSQRFLLAHELGHIAFALAPPNINELQWSQAMAEQLVPSTAQHRTETIRDVAEELAADLLGAQMVMSSCKDSFECVIAIGSCEAVFVMREMLDAYKATRRAEIVSGLIPPKIRTSCLRSAMKGTVPESSMQLGDAIQQLGSNLVLRVKLASATAGDVNSQYWVSEAYKEGDGIGKNATESWRWLLQAAKGGHADAQFSVGSKYDQGDGVRPDSVEAVRWFKLAADQGEHWAMYNLANAFRTGNGISMNLGEAVRLYRIVAEAGIPHAQANWGCCLRDGLGTARNLIEAYKWFLLANTPGILDTEQHLRDMRGMISPENRKLAEKLAEKWRQENYEKRGR